MSAPHRKVRCPGCGSAGYPSDPICMSCGRELPHESVEAPLPEAVSQAREDRATGPSGVNGTAVLLLGAISLILSHFTIYALLLGPVAWLLGNRSLRALRLRGDHSLERGQIQVGRICGMISTAFLALLLALVVPLLGLGLLSGGKAAGAPTVRLNAPAPAVQLPDLAGQEQTLGAYRGRLLLVNFFASW
jgi:hypothetical protein